MLQTMDDSELMRRYRLDRAGIVFVSDLIREKLTSPTQRRNAIAPEMKIITTLRYLATGTMPKLCSSDDLGPSQPSISRVITDNYSTFRSSYCFAVHCVSTGHSHLAGSKNSI